MSEIENSELSASDLFLPEEGENSISRLADPAFFKEQLINADLAWSLYKEASDLPDNFQLRWNKLYLKYEMLNLRSPSMFEAALAGTLLTGDIGKMFHIITTNSNDPEAADKALKEFHKNKSETLLNHIENVKNKAQLLDN